MTSRKQAKFGDGQYENAIRYFKEVNIDNAYAGISPPQMSEYQGASSFGSHKRSHNSHGYTRESKRYRVNDKDSNRNNQSGGSHSSGAQSSPRNQRSQLAGDVKSRHSSTDHDVNEWTLHVSSTGKTYYYNKKTEKSQWEKPSDMHPKERQSSGNKEKKHSNNNKDIKNGEKKSHRSTASSKWDNQSPRSDRSRQRYSRHNNLSTETVKSVGSSTYAASTSSYRPTCEGRANHSDGKNYRSADVQDISPPGSPTPCNISLISPSSNGSPSPNTISASTNNALNSPKPQMNSPLISGLSLSMLKNTNAHYRPSENFTHSKPSQPAHQTHGSHLTTKLHPLQQATLLQQQQIYGLSNTKPDHHQISMHQSETGVGSHNQAHNSPSNSGMRVSTIKSADGNLHGISPNQSTHHRNPSMYDGGDGTSCGLSRSLSDPRLCNMAFHQSQSGSCSPAQFVPRSSREIEPAIQWSQLPNLEHQTESCSKDFQDFSAGWYGSLFDKQADNALQDTDYVLSLESGKSISSCLISKLQLNYAETRTDCLEKRLSCYLTVAEKLTSLQDHRSGS